MSKLYAVRQYRPGYCTGFENSVLKNIEYGKILEAPWLVNFKHSNFAKFTIEPYTNDELIISAKYANDESWIAGFALPMDSNEIAPDGGLLINNWRYREHKS